MVKQFSKKYFFKMMFSKAHLSPLKSWNEHEGVWKKCNFVFITITDYIKKFKQDFKKVYLSKNLAWNFNIPFTLDHLVIFQKHVIDHFNVFTRLVTNVLSKHHRKWSMKKWQERNDSSPFKSPGSPRLVKIFSFSVSEKERYWAGAGTALDCKRDFYI